MEKNIVEIPATMSDYKDLCHELSDNSIIGLTYQKNMILEEEYLKRHDNIITHSTFRYV